MISRKTFAGLLAGASMSALLLVTPQAHAQSLELNNPGDCDVLTPGKCEVFGFYETIEVDDNFEFDGDVIVHGPIGGDEENPIFIEDGADIDGAFIIAED